MTDTVSSLREQLLQLKSLHDSGALSQATYDDAKATLERKLVDLVTAGAPAGDAPSAQANIPASTAPAAPKPRPGTRLLALAGIVALLVAAGGYWWTGSPAAIGIDPTAAAPANEAPHALDKGQIAAMTEKLAARMKERPDDAEGWSMLGRSYMVLEKADESVAAYERAVKLRPDDAGTLVDYADALAVKNGRNLAGEPAKLVERALKLEPDNLKALMLAGTVAFNLGDFAGAVKHWERIGAVGPADNPIVQGAVGAVAEARQRGNLPAAAAPMAAPAATVKADAAPGATAKADASVTGTVSLSPALKAQASPEDTVFIFARPAEGSRMPLAIVRKQVKDLPYAFRLDDAMAMSPQATLSKAGRVVVGARVSKSGQAMPQPGDLEGLSKPIDVGTSGLAITISEALR